MIGYDGHKVDGISIGQPPFLSVVSAGSWRARCCKASVPEEGRRPCRSPIVTNDTVKVGETVFPDLPDSFFADFTDGGRMPMVEAVHARRRWTARRAADARTVEPAWPHEQRRARVTRSADPNGAVDRARRSHVPSAACMRWTMPPSPRGRRGPCAGGRERCRQEHDDQAARRSACGPTPARSACKGTTSGWPAPQHAHALGAWTVFQELMLFPGMTVAENLLLTREPRGALGVISRRRMAERPRRCWPAWGSRISIRWR